MTATLLTRDCGLRHMNTALLISGQGLGLVPPLGYSTWNDCGSTPNETWVKRTARYLATPMNDSLFLATYIAFTILMRSLIFWSRYLIDSGLARRGYRHINVDEGWMLGRDPETNQIVEDRSLFPSGMKALGDWIHAQEIPGTGGKRLRYGLYTCRGRTQCTRPEYRARCLHSAPNPPACLGPHPNNRCGCEGSLGYEELDGKWMVEAGADYIKEDSCSATGGSINPDDHAGAFKQ